MSSYKIIVIDNAYGIEAWSADVMAGTPRGSVMALAARLEATTHTAPVVKPTAIVEPSKGKAQLGRTVCDFRSTGYTRLPRQ